MLTRYMVAEVEDYTEPNLRQQQPEILKEDLSKIENDSCHITVQWHAHGLLPFIRRLKKKKTSNLILYQSKHSP